MEIITKSAKETKKLGEKYAVNIKVGKKGAYVIGLVGDLGSGKTTFVQGFARGLKIAKRLLSPTYNIVRRYNLEYKQRVNLYHIDLYRIEKSKELKGLGFEEILSDSCNIVLIEWVDKIESVIKKCDMVLSFVMLDESKRKIITTYGGS